MGINHIPVLLDEVINMLVKDKDGIYLDCTVGFGGHSSEILQTISNNGFLIGLDLDPYALKKAKEKLRQVKNRKFALHHSSYKEFPAILSKFGITKVDGFLFDLGISSYQVNSEHRGFSYMSDSPLDMRFNPIGDNQTAYCFLKNIGEDELSKAFKIYGNISQSKKIAKGIIQRRNCNKMKTTSDLKKAVKDSIGIANNKMFSRIFQTIRICVNKELEVFKETLQIIPNFLNKNGRICIISFHSIEDRITKHFFKDMIITNENDYYKKKSINCNYKLAVITRKPIIASKEEIKINIRSRSAKLRVAERK